MTTPTFNDGSEEWIIPGNQVSETPVEVRPRPVLSKVVLDDIAVIWQVLQVTEVCDDSEKEVPSRPYVSCNHRKKNKMLKVANTNYNTCCKGAPSSKWSSHRYSFAFSSFLPLLFFFFLFSFILHACQNKCHFREEKNCFKMNIPFVNFIWNINRIFPIVPLYTLLKTILLVCIYDSGKETNRW